MILLLVVFSVHDTNSKLQKEDRSSEHALTDASKYCVVPQCVVWCPYLLILNNLTVLWGLSETSERLAHLMLFAKALAKINE